MNRSCLMFLIAMTLADSLPVGWLLSLWIVLVSIPFLAIGAMWWLLIAGAAVCANVAVWLRRYAQSRIYSGADQLDDKER